MLSRSCNVNETLVPECKANIRNKRLKDTSPPLQDDGDTISFQECGPFSCSCACPPFSLSQMYSRHKTQQRPSKKIHTSVRGRGGHPQKQVFVIKNHIPSQRYGKGAIVMTKSRLLSINLLSLYVSFAGVSKNVAYFCVYSQSLLPIV